METPKAKLRVGYNSSNYPEKRNIINKIPDVDYLFTKDVYSFMGHIKGRSKLFPKKSQDLEYKFSDYSLNNVDLLHFFNAVSFSKKPWISTFETILPRFKVALTCRDAEPDKIRKDHEVMRAMKALASDACKKNIAISNASKLLQGNYLKLFPEYMSAILDKTVVIHPPQELLLDDSCSVYASDPPTSNLNLTFIGHHFFRKGGNEILMALNNIRGKLNRKIQLTIISKLNSDAYATSTTEKDFFKARKFIEQNQDWIKYHESLPYAETLKTIKNSHIGMLPSYAETYGYSVLEYQATGCPVITTNIRSFPEINNNDVGWVIAIPKRDDGEAIYKEKGGKESISQCIFDGLRNIIIEIDNNPGIIKEKGENAIERIRKMHDPVDYASKLLEIYKNALIK